MRPNWDDTWMAVAQVISRRSLCVRDKVGAVIVDPRNRIVATGYNGPPSGFATSKNSSEDHWTAQPCSEWCSRAKTCQQTGWKVPDYSDCPSLHAEANALSVCDRSVREGGKIYITSDVCFACAKLIANSDLAEVHALETVKMAERRADKSYQFLEQCGVTVYVV